LALASAKYRAQEQQSEGDRQVPPVGDALAQYEADRGHGHDQNDLVIAARWFSVWRA
jgi:hypothetical protein